jgi:hypothetical protein
VKAGQDCPLPCPNSAGLPKAGRCDRPHERTGVGVLQLPGEAEVIDSIREVAPTLFFILVLALIIFGTFFSRTFDKRRITRDIESRGGRIVRIEGARIWLESRYDRSYQVTYVTPAEETITATCRTSGSSGVFWIRDSPPGLAADSKAMGMDSSARSGDKPMQCLGCGAAMAANDSRCRQCGWSYKQS